MAALHTGGPTLNGGCPQPNLSATTPPLSAGAAVAAVSSPMTTAGGVGCIKYPGGGYPPHPVSEMVAPGYETTGIVPGSQQQQINMAAAAAAAAYHHPEMVQQQMMAHPHPQAFAASQPIPHQRLLQNAPTLMDSSNYYVHPQACWSAPTPSSTTTVSATGSFEHSSNSVGPQSTTPTSNSAVSMATAVVRGRRVPENLIPSSISPFYATPTPPPVPLPPPQNRYAPQQPPMYHHNPAVCIPTPGQPSPYMTHHMHPHSVPTGLHDPQAAFAAAATMNGVGPQLPHHHHTLAQQRIFINAGAAATRMPGPGPPGIRAYFPPDGTGPMFLATSAATTTGMGGSEMVGAGRGMHQPQPPTMPPSHTAVGVSGGGGAGAKKSETTAAKKKRAKATKNPSRAAAARAANNNRMVPAPSTKMVGLGPGGTPSMGSLLSAQAAPGGGMMLAVPPSLGPPPPPHPMWGTALPTPRMDNNGGGGGGGGGMMMAPHLHQQMHPHLNLQHHPHHPQMQVPPAPPGTPHARPLQSTTPQQQQQQQQQHPVPCTAAVFAPATTSTPAPPPNASCPTPAMLPPNTADPMTERLVCPITNGTVLRPVVLELDNDGNSDDPIPTVKDFEFDISENHLETIVVRSDLEIVVCAHLVNEPQQMCHWPDEAAFVRFNGTELALDRTVTPDGLPAHKVCGIKGLCQPGKNSLEVILIPNRNASNSTGSGASSGFALKDHRLTVFMAHMPALSMVLDGLQRRLTDDAVPLTTLVLNSWRSQQQQQLSSTTTAATTPNNSSANGTSPIVASISLVCPVFRTRMQIPGRISGCQHVEVFDMEAFLHREVLWPRLLCPICRNGSSSGGLDNLQIDPILANIIQMTPKSALSVQVRSDGFWRLSPPLSWQLPPRVDQWQPMVGPHTQAFSIALESPPLHSLPANSTNNGAVEFGGPSPAKRNCRTTSSPLVEQQQQQQLQQAPSELQGSAPGLHVTNSIGAQNPSSASPTISANTPENAATAVPPHTPQWSQATHCSPVPQLGHRKRGHSSSSLSSASPGHQHHQHHFTPPSSEPDLRSSMSSASAASTKATIHTKTAPPRSLPPTPTAANTTFVKPSPPGPAALAQSQGSSAAAAPLTAGNGLCKSLKQPQEQAFRRILQRLGEPSEEVVRWAFEGGAGLEAFKEPEYIQFVNSL